MIDVVTLVSETVFDACLVATAQSLSDVLTLVSEPFF